LTPPLELCFYEPTGQGIVRSPLLKFSNRVTTVGPAIGLRQQRPVLNSKLHGSSVLASIHRVTRMICPVRVFN
jgi:hypothetical protein